MILAVALVAQAAGGESISSGPRSAVWRPQIASGYDLFINSYSLAETDTTETVAEAAVLVGVVGHSLGNSRRKWRLSGEASSGTELWRESLAGDVRWIDVQGRTRFRVRGEGRGRQYRADTRYGLSSDNREGRLDLRGYPLSTDQLVVENRVWARGRHFKTPSSLELNQSEIGGGVAVRSRSLYLNSWSLGSKFVHRSYPDSARINRDTISLMGAWTHQGDKTLVSRINHRTDHRSVADEAARPSAWTHWTEVDLEKPTTMATLFLELRNEIWNYGGTSEAFQDFWRLGGRLGSRWGDVLGTRWQTGVSGELWRSGDNAESYTQYGLLGGVESYGERLTGSCLMEFGRRSYQAGATIEPDLTPVSPGDTEINLGYSDFNYWKIWLTAHLVLGNHFDLDVLANYEPERHGETNDNTTLAFASVRLVWHP